MNSLINFREIGEKGAPLASPTAVSSVSTSDQNSINALLQSVQSISQLLNAQTAQINELKQEIIMLKSNNQKMVSATNAAISTIPTSYKISQDQMIQRMDQSFERLSQKHLKSIDEHFMTQNMKLNEMLVSKLPESVINSISTRLHNYLRQDFKQQVLEKISQSCTKFIEPKIQESYKEVFNSFVIPSFEKACQAMFSQINASFQKGCQEYSCKLVNNLDGIRAAQLSAIELAVSSVHQAAKTISSAKLSQEAEDELVQKITLAVTEQVVGCLSEKCESTAVQATNSINMQQTIKEIVNKGLINNAFETALSANDLSLVVYTCELVNPQQVFNQNPCPLTQRVLLSLIQQLSLDLSENTEIKHKYLEEAVMNLDMSLGSTRSHTPTIITQLQKQLQAFITANPNQKITRAMKMLLMATQAVLQETENTNSARPLFSR